MKHPLARIIAVATATFAMLYWLFNKQLTKPRVSKTQTDPQLLKFQALNEKNESAYLTPKRFSVPSKYFFSHQNDSRFLNLENQNHSNLFSNPIQVPTISEQPAGNRLINEQNLHFDDLPPLEKSTSPDPIDEKLEIINPPHLSDSCLHLTNSDSNNEDLEHEFTTLGYYTPQLSPSSSMNQLPVV